MGVFGFGNVGGAVGEDALAGFPASGLVALYKCDELDGSVLKDATGNLPDIALATGVALDCTTHAQYVLDATGLRAALNGRPATAVFGAEFVAPALVSDGTTHRILGGAGTSGTSGPGFQLSLVEDDDYGSAGSRFTVNLRIRVSKDGGATSNYDYVLDDAGFQGVAAGAVCQIVGKLLIASDVVSTVVFHVRIGANGEWQKFTRTFGTAGTTLTIADGSGSEYRVGVTGTSTSPFLGKLLNVFLAQGDYDIEDAKNALCRPSQTFVRSVFSGAYARFWSFNSGTGDTCKELIGGTFPAITGTRAWGTGLSGCTQPSTRQGIAYYGKAGVRLGGEAGFVPVGRGISGAAAAPFLASGDGWSMVVTMRAGNNLPAAEQVLVSAYGLDGTGAKAATLAALPGVHLTIGTDGEINARYKRLATGNDTGNGFSFAVGDGAGRVTHGLLTTYVIRCSAAGAVTCAKVAAGASAVTEIAGPTGNAGNVILRSAYIELGSSAIDADLIVGFLGFYNRALTNAETMQCHKMSLARMIGTPIYVNNGTGNYGNGTELSPYTTHLSASRTLQPNQQVYIAAGTYERLVFTGGISVATAPSWQDGATFTATGAVVIVNSDQVATTIDPPVTGTESHYPLTIDYGTWHFTTSGSGTWTADADSFFAGAGNCSEDVDSVTFYNFTFTGAVKTNDSNGTGLASRATYTALYDCTSSDNEEHGVYLRRIKIGEVDALDGQFIVDGLTVDSTSGEDGLKVTTEGAFGAIWRNSMVNNLRVTGGKNQLYILGCDGLKVTNFLLTGQTYESALVGACLLGREDGYDGETLESDYTLRNAVFANGTVSVTGAGTPAVHVRGGAGTDIRLVNILTEGCALDYLDATTGGTVTIETCAGDAEDGEWPATGGNIPGAAIDFVGATYVLEPTSDGYGDGTNLTGLSDEAEVDFAGDPRPATGAWNIGAY